MYATAQDIVDLYGRQRVKLIALRPDEHELDDPLTAKAIDDALSQATSEADSYVAQRHATPLADPPRALQVHVINMACHHLAASHDRMTTIIRQRYEDALRWLADISRGKARLGPGGTGAAGTTGKPAPGHIVIVSTEAQFRRAL